MIVKPAKNPGAVVARDSYVVARQFAANSYEIVESWWSRPRAENAKKILEKHEHDNGRSSTFVILRRKDPNNFNSPWEIVE